MEDLKGGDDAPDFDLADATGKRWKLSELHGNKVILYFYPADDTPGCTVEGCDFRDSYEDLKAAGYVVFGVSPQGPDSHQKFSTKYGLNFPLLVDEDHAVAEKYGAWGENKYFKNIFLGIKRSTFVIDEDGRIEEAQYGVKAKGHVERLKAALGI
ncbi:MAG: thioredoxin-dependent peroxiredoxin [Actinomycetota bacterium]|jgi:peroxiredoxin Q/BCP|nr:thioredoxin-dependent peroxiredoxin [Actinomycetota bacterium]